MYLEPKWWIHNGDVVETRALEIIACRGAYAPEVADGSHFAAEPWEDYARLIVAAPELLEALQQAADYMAEMGHPEEILGKARAAIAKAGQPSSQKP